MRIPWVASFAARALAPPVAAYITRQQKQLTTRAEPLSRQEMTALRAYFPLELLQSVRIAIADPLPLPDPPFAPLVRRFGFDYLAPSLAEAVTFSDVIAARGPLQLSTLFHELVHVVQYRELGIGGFAREYVRGFLVTGTYREIPLERSAFELQRRYDRGESFDAIRAARNRIS